jgi:hypothetical protein
MEEAPEAQRARQGGVACAASVERILDRLGNEVLRVKTRGDALSALAAGARRDEFTNAEREHIREAARQNGEHYRTLLAEFRRKLDVYEKHVERLVAVIGRRAAVIDAIYDASPSLRHHPELMDAFRAEHETLVRELQKSTRELES